MYELPAEAAGWEDLAEWGGEPCRVLLPESPLRSKDAEIEAVDNPAIGIERFLSLHIERCNDLSYPDQAGEDQWLQLGSLVRWEWAPAQDVYFRQDDEEGPVRLIVRIAAACRRALEEVCLRPRVALRRERLLTPLERVRQIDANCLRWLSRQPGRNVAEKAGSKRRVLAVERVESADTPENRVVKDMLTRCAFESARYLNEHRNKREKTRYRDVEEFRALVQKLLRDTAIRGVPRATGSVTPNYVLQFDSRYALIWHWYQRLRRQHTALNDAWRWQRRVFAEHVRFACAAALSEYIDEQPAVRKRVYIHSEPNRGVFLDDVSQLGWWRNSKSDIMVATAAQAREAQALGIWPDALLDLGADIVVHSPKQQRTMAIIGILQPAASAQDPNLLIQAMLREGGVSGGSALLVIAGSPTSLGEPVEARGRFGDVDWTWSAQPLEDWSAARRAIAGALRRAGIVS